MSRDLTITVPVREGHCQFSDSQLSLVRNYLAGYKDGATVTVKWSKPKLVRSLKQNAYLWVVYGYIAEYTGMDAESVHEWCKDEFLPRRFVTLGGREKEIRKTSADLSQKEFAEYTEKIIAWAGTEFGIQIPEL